MWCLFQMPLKYNIKQLKVSYWNPNKQMPICKNNSVRKLSTSKKTFKEQKT